MQALVIFLSILAVLLGILLILHLIRWFMLFKKRKNDQVENNDGFESEAYDFYGSISEIQDKYIMVEISEECWQHLHSKNIKVDYTKHIMKFDAQMGDNVTVKYTGDIKENPEHLQGVVYSIVKND